jgi:hypothetical protein
MDSSRTESAGTVAGKLVIAAGLSGLPAHGLQELVFAGGVAESRLQYEDVAGHLFVRGTIGASGPLWFTLDTGASLSLLDEACARRLGLALAPGQSITGAGGTEHGQSARDVVLRLGSVELRERELDVLPLDSLRRALGRDVDLVLGYELWSRLVVEIDPLAREICLHDPEAWTWDEKGEAIPITLIENCPYVGVQLELPGVGRVDAECIIDTGSGNTLILQGEFVARHGLRERLGLILPLRAGGVGGEFEMGVGRLPGLRVGNFEIERPLVLLGGQGEFAERGRAGNVGCGFLRRFKTIFDYPRGRMILEANARFAEPEEFDMSGVGFRMDAAEPDGLCIAAVRPGSPAEEAGLRAGDRLVAIDGRPAVELGLERVRALLREDGRERLLAIRRGDELRDVRVKLRRMV